MRKDLELTCPNFKILIFPMPTWIPIKNPKCWSLKSIGGSPTHPQNSNSNGQNPTKHRRTLRITQNKPIMELRVHSSMNFWVPSWEKHHYHKLQGVMCIINPFWNFPPIKPEGHSTLTPDTQLLSCCRSQLLFLVTLKIGASS